jgi:branched-chain amino acid transport system substrate-binding protein
MLGDGSSKQRGSDALERGSDSEDAHEEATRTRTLRTRRPSRRATTVLGALAVAALVLSTVWVLSDAREREVTIVAIVPLSGASSYLVEIEDAMSLTVEKLNKWGGINGMRIRLIVEDCGSNPEAALEALREAEEKYHPLAVLTATRGAAVPMSEIAEDNGIILISVGATGENLTEGKEWVFRYYLTPSGEAETTFSTIENLNVSSLGILHLDDAYGNRVMAQLSEVFEASGGTVETHGFASNCTDFSETVANVTDNEAVFAVALRHQYQAIFNELNSSGYSGHVLCAVEASIPEMWGMPEAQGTYVSAPIMYIPGATIDTHFMAEFEERYGQPLTHQGAISSDALRLIWGLLSDNEVSRENLRNLLSAGFVHSGLVGVVTLLPNEHNIDIPLFPALIEGGALQYL